MRSNPKTDGVVSDVFAGYFDDDWTNRTTKIAWAMLELSSLSSTESAVVFFDERNSFPPLFRRPLRRHRKSRGSGF